jgi:hypothetical protein
MSAREEVKFLSDTSKYQRQVSQMLRDQAQAIDEYVSQRERANRQDVISVQFTEEGYLQQPVQIQLPARERYVFPGGGEQRHEEAESRNPEVAIFMNDRKPEVSSDEVFWLVEEILTGTAVLRGINLTDLNGTNLQPNHKVPLVVFVVRLATPRLVEKINVDLYLNAKSHVQPGGKMLLISTHYGRQTNPLGDVLHDADLIRKLGVGNMPDYYVQLLHFTDPTLGVGQKLVAGSDIDERAVASLQRIMQQTFGH